MDTFARPQIKIEHRPDGSVLLNSTVPLGPHAEHLAQELRRWARQTPDAVLASVPDGTRGRRTVTFSEARRAADALAQGLLDLGATPDRPVLLLSGNSLEHLLLTLACYTAGVPAVPTSVASSLMSADHHQIRAMADLVTPGVVFADEQGAPDLKLVPGVSVALELVAGRDGHRLDRSGRQDWIPHAGEATRLGVGGQMPGVAEVHHAGFLLGISL